MKYIPPLRILYMIIISGFFVYPTFIDTVHIQIIIDDKKLLESANLQMYNPKNHRSTKCSNATKIPPKNIQKY